MSSSGGLRCRRTLGTVRPHAGRARDQRTRRVPRRFGTHVLSGTREHHGTAPHTEYGSDARAEDEAESRVGARGDLVTRHVQSGAGVGRLYWPSGACYRWRPGSSVVRPAWQVWTTGCTRIDANPFAGGHRQLTRNPLLPHEHYDTEHRHPVNRALHMVGIPVVLLSLAAIVSPWRPFAWSRTDALMLMAGGWALLFAGHAIEGNRPAILRDPAAALSGVVWWLRSCRRKRGDM
jgi:hypothetical protein